MEELKLYKKFSNLEDLEFELLEEIKIEDFNINNDLIEKFKGLLEGYSYYSSEHIFAIILKILDKKIIARNEKNFYLINKSNYDVKDIICFNENIIFKIENEIFNEEFLNKLSEKNTEGFNIKNLKKDETLTKERLEKEIIKNYKKEKREKNKEEKEEKEKEIREKKDEIEREKSFKEESICEFKDFKIDKKIVIQKYYNSNVIFTFKKNVNQLFDYDTMENKSFEYANVPNLSTFESFIIKNKIDYTKETEENGKKFKLYDLEFERDTKKEILSNLEDKEFVNYPKIKGVRIPKNKLGFILSQIKEEPTKKRIELLKRLNQMKIELLNLGSISCENHRIDIDIFLIDEYNFLVKFMNKRKTFSWDTLKSFLFYGGSSRHIYSSLSQIEFLKFCEKFNITKQDVFMYIKRLKMLKELEEKRK